MESRGKESMRVMIQLYDNVVVWQCVAVIIVHGLSKQYSIWRLKLHVKIGLWIQLLG
jgi:hypothetical protein